MERFHTWLTTKRDYGQRSANDVVSRCRRVQRILGVSLDQEVRSKRGFSALHERLWREGPRHLKKGANQTTSISILGTAMRLYYEFKTKQKFTQ